MAEWISITVHCILVLLSSTSAKWRLYITYGPYVSHAIQRRNPPNVDEISSCTLLGIVGRGMHSTECLLVKMFSSHLLTHLIHSELWTAEYIHVLYTYLLFTQAIQSTVLQSLAKMVWGNILYLMVSPDHTHTQSKMASAAAAATYQTFTRQHFKQLDEHLAISQVDVQVLNTAVDTCQMRVNPLSERLLLHTLSLVFTRTNSDLVAHI